MSVRFSIDSWAAWAPGLTDQAAWAEWFAVPRAVVGDDLPALSEMSPLLRRRVERLGRAALQVAYRALGDAPPCPTVFASRYGDLRRSIDLMKQLAVDGAVSPTAFSMSVHNAFAALFSIARGDRSNYSSVAAGAETAECAFVEALALLDEGAPQALIVYYDEPPPEPLATAATTVGFPRAWACRIGRAQDAGIAMQHSRSTMPCDVDAPDTECPSDLALLKFLVGNEAAHTRRVDDRQWHWART